ATVLGALALGWLGNMAGAQMPEKIGQPTIRGTEPRIGQPILTGAEPQIGQPIMTRAEPQIGQPIMKGAEGAAAPVVTYSDGDHHAEGGWAGEEGSGESS